MENKEDNIPRTVPIYIRNGILNEITKEGRKHKKGRGAFIEDIWDFYKKNNNLEIGAAS